MLFVGSFYFLKQKRGITRVLAATALRCHSCHLDAPACVCWHISIITKCFELSPVGRKSGQQGLGASRLPVFSPQEKSYIKGTCDFLGLGHFTTRYVTLKNYPSGLGDSYFADRDLAELVDPQWPDPGSEWLYSVPWGFRRLLNFVKVHDAKLQTSSCERDLSNIERNLLGFCCTRSKTNATRTNYKKNSSWHK